MPLIEKTFLGFFKEAAWGTPGAPTVWIPCRNVKPEIDIARIMDSGYRGAPAKDFEAYAGARKSKVSFDIDGFADHMPRFLARVLGTDAITGVGPYTHTITALDTAPSETIADFDGISERRYAGSFVESVTLKFLAETGMLEASVSAQGKAPADNAASVPVISATAPYLGWQASMTIAGAGNTDVLGGEVSIKRSVHLVYGSNNTQDPTRGFVGGDIEVSGKLTFYAPDSVVLDYYRNTTKPVVVLTFTSGANTLTVTMSKCDFEKVVPDRQSGFVKWDVTFRGIYNATDGGPIKIVAVNGINAAY